MSSLARESIESIGRRLSGPARGKLEGDPCAARALADALLEGKPLQVALQSLGSDARLSRAVELASPSDVPAALDGIADELVRFQARRGQLVAAASYAVIVAASSAVFGTLVTAGTVPALARVRGAATGAPDAGAFAVVAPLVLALSFAALGYLAFALISREPLFPLRRVKLSMSRALALGAASCLARQVPLPAALRAGAHLTGSRALERDAGELASGLDAGQPEGRGRLLLGELGAAIFAGGVSHGAGLVTLEAMARLQHASAERLLPSSLRRAETLAVLFGGASLLASAATFYSAYLTSVFSR
jgi:uncharacterized membrane protein YraQ (UPF0718 family)